MKTMSIVSTCCAAMCLTTGCLATTNPPLSDLAVKVVDETGAPISNAYVKAYTYWLEGWNAGRTKGYTDTNGVFRYDDHVSREISYKVYKDGYYCSHGEAWWPKTLYEVPETNIVVIMKRIIEPCPLLYRKISIALPRLDVPFPFDLEIGDWVFPDGKGKVPDIWVSGNNAWVSDLHYDYYASFSVSNRTDGFTTFNVMPKSSLRLKSELRPPQRAPGNGYASQLEFHGGKHREPTGTRWINSRYNDRIYVFRVRSITNDVGEVVSANVGWFEGAGTGVGGEKDGSLGMALEYYFNPDQHSRSLEPKDLAEQQKKAWGGK